MSTHRMKSGLDEYLEIVVPDNYRPPQAIKLDLKSTHGSGYEPFVLTAPLTEEPVPDVTRLATFEFAVSAGLSAEEEVIFRTEEGSLIDLSKPEWERLGEPREITVRITPALREEEGSDDSDTC